MKQLLLIIITYVFLTPNISFAEKTWKELSKEITQAIESSNLGRHSIETDYKSQGELEITGYVSSEADKILIEDRLSQIQGIKTIINELTVRTEVARLPNEKEKKLNDIIKKSVDDALLGKKYEMQIDNFNGEVILKGFVSEPDSIATITKVVKNINGVSQLNNLIQLYPAPSDPELTARIKEAFSQEDNLQAEDIKIEAKNGVVTLSGSKRSHRVVDRILSIVQMVDGVKKIISNIEIEK
jgi:hyperosmotically inducible protein